MNFLNRAIKNITRVKSRSILLMITFFILGNLIIIGLGVSQAVTDAKAETRKSMRPVVSYEVDYRAADEAYMALETDEERNDFKWPRVTKQMVNDLVAMDDRIVAVNYIQSLQIYGNGITPVEINTNNNGGGMIMYEDGTTATYRDPDFLIKGNLFPDMIEFVEGGYVIVDGRMYTQEEIDNGSAVVLIEQALADVNGLHVGDTISISIYQDAELEYYGGYITKEDTTIELEIIGIYDDLSTLDPSEMDYYPNHMYPENTVLMPTSTYVKMQVALENKLLPYFVERYPEYYEQLEEFEEDDYYYGNVVILLNDPLEVDAFLADNSDAIGEYFMFNANMENFNRISRPLDAMARFADILVGIIVVNALVIVTLITALTLKNREYEIGVLLAMGVTKVKVIAQMFVELVVVGVLGFTLAIGSGALVSGVIGDWMLEAQLSTEMQEETDNNYGYYWGETDYFTTVTADEMFSKYHVSVKPIMIVWIYAGGLGIIFLSVLVPGLMVMRYNPKQILTNVR